MGRSGSSVTIVMEKEELKSKMKTILMSDFLHMKRRVSVTCPSCEGWNGWSEFLDMSIDKYPHDVLCAICAGFSDKSIQEIRSSFFSSILGISGIVPYRLWSTHLFN
jgi:hypothetical protein